MIRLRSIERSGAVTLDVSLITRPAMLTSSIPLINLLMIYAAILIEKYVRLFLKIDELMKGI